MPSNWLTTDSNLPTFTGKESTKEQLEVVLEYMVTLTENLRYSLQNLGTDNWNDAEMNALVQRVSAGVSQQLGAVSATVGQFSNTLQKLREDLEALQKTVKGLEQAQKDLQAAVKAMDENYVAIIKEQADSILELSDIIRGRGGLAERIAELEQAQQEGTA